MLLIVLVYVYIYTVHVMTMFLSDLGRTAFDKVVVFRLCVRIQNWLVLGLHR